MKFSFSSNKYSASLNKIFINEFASKNEYVQPINANPIISNAKCTKNQMPNIFLFFCTPSKTLIFVLHLRLAFITFFRGSVPP